MPLVDERGRLVAVAINRDNEVRIGRFQVDKDSPALVISEIGINHQGSVDFAKELVDRSVEAGADVVKFQLRDMAALYRQGSGRAAAVRTSARSTPWTCSRSSTSPPTSSSRSSTTAPTSASR